MKRLQSVFRKRKPEEETKDITVSSPQESLANFSGVFKVTPLGNEEQIEIENILVRYQEEGQDIQLDAEKLKAITSEVKAINNQAIILHGERIKHAQNILKKYKDGAFSSWLLMTYGNRQTPYNFLQYFEFYQSLSLELKEKMTDMPRQAVYTLASREGPTEKKTSIIKNYQGESKQALLEQIRDTFPLAQTDGRKKRTQELLLESLSNAKKRTQAYKKLLSPKEKEEALKMIEQLKDLLSS